MLVAITAVKRFFPQEHNDLSPHLENMTVMASQIPSQRDGNKLFDQAERTGHGISYKSWLSCGVFVAFLSLYKSSQVRIPLS